MKILAIIIVLALAISSCNQKQDEKSLNQINNKEIDKTSAIEDSISTKFAEALINDSVEFYNWEPFYAIKSGYILNNTEKNLILVSCPSDSTYTLELFAIIDNHWKFIDSVSNLVAFPVQFEATFNDYNFDGQKDIYIQTSASNGYSLSRGNLIIIDPESKKMKLHVEAREFANMRPDKHTKSVISEIWEGKDLYGNLQLTYLTNIWQGEQLKTINKTTKTIIINYN
jgi:hypothetical protein